MAFSFEKTGKIHTPKNLIQQFFVSFSLYLVAGFKFVCLFVCLQVKETGKKWISKYERMNHKKERKWTHRNTQTEMILNSCFLTASFAFEFVWTGITDISDDGGKKREVEWHTLNIVGTEKKSSIDREKRSCV